MASIQLVSFSEHLNFHDDYVRWNRPNYKSVITSDQFQNLNQSHFLFQNSNKGMGLPPAIKLKKMSKTNQFNGQDCCVFRPANTCLRMHLHGWKRLKMLQNNQKHTFLSCVGETHVKLT